MPISLISNIAYFKNKFVIGKQNNLLLHIKKDMDYFRCVTTTTENNLTLKKNIVVMGSNTWQSLPSYLLKNRINIVITNDKKLQNLSNNFSLKTLKKDQKLNNNNIIYFLSYSNFKKFYKKHNPTVFLIGGSKLYTSFLNDEELKPNKLYITEIYDYNFVSKNLDDYIYFEPFDDKYKLISFSEKYFDKKNKVSFRFLQYKLVKEGTNNIDSLYLKLCKNIIENGKERIDRTGTGTVSIFGSQIHYDASYYIPLLTTKNVPWKHVIEELLWFIRGDTDSKILNKKGVKIWNGNTSRSFLDSNGLYDYPEGILGAGYSWQWRFFGGEYSTDFSDTSKIDRSLIGGFDQLKYIENELKTNPYSRRILMCYWNPPDFKKTALLPCHYSCQFYVEKSGSDNILNCLFNMRSNDIFLGHPFNIASYAILTYILALRCNMVPGKIIYTGGDVHIYKNHFSQIFKQMSRTPRSLPILYINPEVKNKTFEEITISDFELIGYYPHPVIKAPMAI